MEVYASIRWKVMTSSICSFLPEKTIGKILDKIKKFIFPYDPLL